MSHRFQIVVSSNNKDTGRLAALEPQGWWGRFKSLFVRIGIVVLALSVLVAALILGSVLAIVIAGLIATVVAIGIVRAALQLKRGKRQI